MTCLPKIRITERRAQKKCCPECGLRQRAAFPESVKAPTQYGVRFTAWTVCLYTFEMLPLGRNSRMFAELTGYFPSEATLLSSLQTMNHSFVDADETGCRIERETQWIHVVSDVEWTLLGVHTNCRGKGNGYLSFIPFYKEPSFMIACQHN